MVHNKLLDDVAEFLHLSLDDRHRTYLFERGVSEASIDKFKIGRFPRLAELFEEFDPVQLREADIVFNATRSRFSRHTLTFPITDFKNSTVAILGRTLFSEAEMQKEGIPKYMHTPYEKSRNLYNLHSAVPFIREKDYVFVVEGQMDVIMADQMGVSNIVALGNHTLSTNQVLSLSKYCSKIIVVPDNDKAGQDGVEKLSTYNKWKYGIELFVAQLPSQYHDMGDFFKENGKGDFLTFIKKSIRRVE